MTPLLVNPEALMSIDTEALTYRLFTAADVDTLPTR